MNEALILAKLAVIEAKLDQILAGGAGGAASPAGGASRGEHVGGKVATDRDLDGQYGDPSIRKDPPAKYWEGASYTNYKMSEVQEPDYLDALAKYLDACAYMASKDAGNGVEVEKNTKSAKFKVLDASRARGWAARLRARGAQQPPAQNDWNDAQPGGADDDIPF